MTNQFDHSKLYDKYRVTLTVRECMHGGIPRNKELIEKWVAARTEHNDAQTAEQIAEHTEALALQQEENAWCGFHEGLFEGVSKPYLETRQINAMLRESCTLLGIFVKKRGSKQIYQHGLEVRGFAGGSKIPIEAQNKGHLERPVHVMTAQGPRSALVRNDFVGEGSQLTFEIWVLTTSAQEKRHLGESDIIDMLTLAQNNGLGANRSQGFGKFDVTAFAKL